MDSWILILLSVGAVIVNAVLKNNKQKREQGRAVGTGQKDISDDEQMPMPDIFSTLFDFSGYKEQEQPKEEVLDVESKSFHDQFEETSVEEAAQESIPDKYRVTTSMEEEVVNTTHLPTSELSPANDEMAYGATVKKYREKIDPRKMIIYAELLKPKYKEV